MAERKPPRVLIAGAGIAGLATAIALQRISGIPGLEIELYEQAPELQEIGASIALSPNGMRTLEKLGVHNALTDEIGYRGPSGIPQIFRHWKTNQVLSVDVHHNVPDPRHHTTRFHRGHLHAALLEHVPRDSIHLNKKVARAEANADEVALFFEDGSTAKGDVLIGADGIRSRVRQSFNPGYQLRFTGKVFIRAVFPVELVEGQIPGLPADSMHWWGPKDNFFASRLGKNQYTTVGAYDDGRPAEEIEQTIAWDQAGDVKFLREKYKDWNPVVKALTDLTPQSRLYPNFAGDALPTWVFASRVTLVGDAAHTHGGAFAAGGSLALDDSYALALAIRHIFASLSSATAAATTDEVPFTGANLRKALGLYDRTRRPHTARLLKIVHGQVKPNPSPATFRTSAEDGKDADAALIERMRNRPDTEWLAEHDVEHAFRAVAEAADGTHGMVLDETRTTPGSLGSETQPPVAVNFKASKL